MQKPHYTPYDHTRFAPDLPYGRRGYLFTVPGDFPEDTPAHTRTDDWEMAVYQSGGDWEVRDVNDRRRVWAIGRTRPGAVCSAFAVIARERRREAAALADKRRAAGLGPVPPVYVETTIGVTLVCTPTVIAVLRWTEATEEGRARYHVHDVDGGDPFVIRADDTVTLQTTTVGVLHHRCGCIPESGVRWFEDETSGLHYAGQDLTFCHPCPQNPTG